MTDNEVIQGTMSQAQSEDAQFISGGNKTYINLSKNSTVAMILLVALSIALTFTLISYLTIKNNVLYQGNLEKYLPIHSGEIHYARLPKQYWQHRILMIKAMGLNSLSVYIMWNYHQLQRGKFDFTTQNKDLNGFLELAKKHGMKVLLRPGPYVCAEWDFGGLPARLLAIDGMDIRNDNKLYESEVQIYFKALSPIIIPHLSQNNGSIIMIQIQNQLGYIRKNNRHTKNLLKMWQNLGVQSEFYYQDPEEVWENNYWPGAHIALSQSSDMLKYMNLELSLKRQKSSLIFGGQVYSGWFTDWGGDWGGQNAEDFAQKIKNIINHNRSVSLYMAFGGSNFAMTAGANGFNPLYDYMPHITSYDYDSPITEQGQPTQKYHLLRQVFQQYYGHKIEQIPPSINSITIDSISLALKSNLLSNLPSPTITKGDLTYFQSNQLKMYDQGMVLYEITLTQSRQYTLKIQARDFALIYIDNVLVKQIVRKTFSTENFNFKLDKSPCNLKILVEAMGHVNFGARQGEDRKGLLSVIDLERKTSFKWNIYRLPVENSMLQLTKLSSTDPQHPSIYEGVFNLEKVGDTFLDMSKWGKGYLWVNGRNLGRYWNIGPQFRLFCPGIWLKEGQNRINVLELLQSSQKTITGFKVLS